MIESILKAVKFQKDLDAQTAGTTAKAGDILDMQNYDGVVFIVNLGAVTEASVVTLKASYGDESDASDFADITDASISFTAGASDSNKQMILDVAHVSKRYIRATVTPATQNAAIDCVISARYSGKAKPATQSSDVIASGFVASA